LILGLFFTGIRSITILHSLPIAALQIMIKEGTWKWVKHIENAVVVNVATALEFLSRSY
jgi:isopenicillin N synthase-like dioxygenase